MALLIRVALQACVRINEGTRAAESAEIIAGVSTMPNLRVCADARYGVGPRRACCAQWW